MKSRGQKSSLVKCFLIANERTQLKPLFKGDTGKCGKLFMAHSKKKVGYSSFKQGHTKSHKVVTQSGQKSVSLSLNTASQTYIIFSLLHTGGRAEIEGRSSYGLVFV